jgi:acetyl-CoA synthetase
MVSRITTLSGYIHEYQKSVLDPEKFWEEIALDFHWQKRWEKTLQWDFQAPSCKWFIHGKLNITENILEKNLFAHGEKTAIIFEPNDGEEERRQISYRELYEEVLRFAEGLKRLDIQKQDRVVLYMPMIPEAIIAMLAVARIGAVHSAVFAGFSAESLANRINDCQAKLVITSNFGLRGEKILPLKHIVDEAILQCPSVKKVIVYERLSKTYDFNSKKDIRWNEVRQTGSIVPLINKRPEGFDAEDMLFILYTSGSTGKPKGIVHTCGGYMVYTAYTFKNVFGYQEQDKYWCTADIGWITGHSYIVYGPLLNGATIVLFEGVPTYPDPGRFWKIIDTWGVNQFYTAPTAIRALQSYGLEWVNPAKLDSLKVIGTVGEPINENAWHWYHQHIGRGRCPVVDTWWQTETGGIMIAPLAGVTPTKPGFATLPLPGIQPCIVDEQGHELKGNSVEGNLCIKFPWPSMLRTTYGDHERCRSTYFGDYKNLYFTGDGARRDEDGYYRILGRVDDVMNVSGHRIGTAEVENAINEHPKVNESAVVAYPHSIKGEAIAAFVVCNLEDRTVANLITEIKFTVSKIIGAFAKPDMVFIVPNLPKTRSGKIMRRILRKIVISASEKENDIEFGDISTLLDPNVVEQIKSVVFQHFQNVIK